MSVSSGGAESSSSREVDFLDLCTSNVHIVEDLAKGESLLNRRQCQDLSSKLSQTVGNIREVVSHSGASPTLFRPALTNLYRYLEKAKLLVTNCAEEDWCAAAVFQCQNENAFRVILLEVGLCYNAIYELAKSHSKERNDLPADLRQSPVFDPATDSNVLEDKEDLQERLDEVASGDRNLKVVDHLIPGRAARRPSMAKYLLDKMHCTSLQPEAIVLGSYTPVLWRKASEPSWTWGSSHFLGAGSGASGVVSTTWLGIPCAKKEFHGIEVESSFMKEAGILVHLKHPNIVDFICCGNGQEKGDRFIAMELMEMSLFDLIKKHKQKGEHFSIPVAVDVMVQVARGVCYLHSKGVAHRDLKPHNVVVSQVNTQKLVDQYYVKLVDFGVSKVEVEASKPNTMTSCGTGTTMYRAPEVHPKANPKSKGIGKVNWLKADAFSFAMTCAHLLSLETPFQDLQPSELYNEVIKNEVRPTIHQMYPEDLVVLLKDCWKTNPRLRPSFADICLRLETFQHKYLRVHVTRDEGFQEETIDTNDGFNFIKRRLDSIIKNRLGNEVEAETSDDIVSSIPCACGSALELLHQLPSYYTGGVICDICKNDLGEDLYNCETCRWGAHTRCVEIKDEVEVFFHDHTLHLLLQNYYNDKSDSICCFCEESLQESEWVYRCEQCDFDVHAICTKFPREVKEGFFHPHLITMRRCLPRKSLTCHWCNGEIKEYTWYYTCGQQLCALTIHPLCCLYTCNLPCIFDSSHRLEIEREQESFYCGRCGAPGFSWSYHCYDGCNVDTHPDCVYYMDEEISNWIGAYEKFMIENGSKDDHTKMNMLLELFINMPTGHIFGASSSRARPPSEAMPRVGASIQKLTLMDRPSFDASKDVNLQRQIAAETAERIKAKKMAVKEASQKLRANLLEMLESMEKVVLDLQSSENMSQDDAEVLAATLEKLKRRQDLVKEQRAMQVQSKMGQGPRIAVFSLEREEDGKWLRELLTSVRADMEGVCWALLCEEPGHEHIVNGLTRISRSEFGEERAEKVGPLIASGLQVVRKAMSTLDPLKLVGLESIILPCLDADTPWDLRAIEHEKHDIRSNDLSEDKEKVEALKQAQDSAAEWLRSWFEEDGVSMLNGFGLQRVRFKVTEKGDYPKYRRCSLAWLCTDHLNSGLKDGTLEQAPLKYYNAEDDHQLRWPHVRFEE